MAALLHLRFFRVKAKTDSEPTLSPGAAEIHERRRSLSQEPRHTLVPTKKGHLAGRLFYFKERSLVLAEILRATYLRARQRHLGVQYMKGWTRLHRSSPGAGGGTGSREDGGEREERAELATNPRASWQLGKRDDRESERKEKERSCASQGTTGAKERDGGDGMKRAVTLLPFGVDGPIILAVVCAGLCGESSEGSSGLTEELEGWEDVKPKKGLGGVKRKTSLMRLGDLHRAQQRELEEQHDLHLALRLIRVSTPLPPECAGHGARCSPKEDATEGLLAGFRGVAQDVGTGVFAETHSPPRVLFICERCALPPMSPKSKPQ